MYFGSRQILPNGDNTAGLTLKFQFWYSQIKIAPNDMYQLFRF